MDQIPDLIRYSEIPEWAGYLKKMYGDDWGLSTPCDVMNRVMVAAYDGSGSLSELCRHGFVIRRSMFCFMDFEEAETLFDLANDMTNASILTHLEEGIDKMNACNLSLKRVKSGSIFATRHLTFANLLLSVIYL